MSQPYPVPALAIPVTIDGSDPIYLRPKRFSSGSVGWYLSEKVEIDGVRVQLSLSAVVVGSKPTATAATTAEDVPQTNGKSPQKARKASKAEKGEEIVQTVLNA